MPIKLEADTLDKLADIPLYKQLADHLRQAIASHDLQPGEALVSEGNAAALTGVDKMTVRRAYDVLTNEGLIVRQAGKVARVAEPPEVRTVANTRHLDEVREFKAGKAFTRLWPGYDLKAETSIEPATQADAHHLGVKVKSKILRRRMIELAENREPVRIQRSAIPYAIAKGTALETPQAEPPPGTATELYAAGLEVTRITEEYGGRPPNNVERRLLKMDTPGLVWNSVITFYVGDKAVEVCRIITPLNRNVLFVETDLSQA